MLSKFVRIFVLLLVHTHYANANVSSTEAPAQEDLKGIGQCYALPYGGLGFTSHLLTFYTIFTVFVGLPPWDPSHIIRSWPSDADVSTPLRHRAANLVLSLTTLVATSAISIISLVRCRGHWHFTLLAISELALSVMLAVVSLRAALIASGRDEKKGPRSWDRFEPTPVGLWLCLLATLLASELVGILGLVMKSWHNQKNVWVVTIAIAGVLVVGILTIGFGAWWWTNSRWTEEGPRWSSGFLGVDLGNWWCVPDIVYAVAALGLVFAAAVTVWYVDWIVGVLTGNIGGILSGDSRGVLCWCFVGARALSLGFS